MDLKLVQNAYWFAKDVHRKDIRDTGERYFEHCRRVALILMEERNVYDAEIIATAFIHDCIEDTHAPPDVILSIFGSTVHEWAYTLSKTLPFFDELSGEVVRREKKDAKIYFAEIHHGPWQVRLLKCADRVDNLRSFGAWDAERKARYIQETEEYILPIAEQVDPWFTKEMKKYCVVGRESAA